MSSAITPDNPLRIAIIGGGIAGLTLAVPLAKLETEGLPIRVHVYEAAGAFGEIGAGVGFGPNAQRVLQKLELSHIVDSANDWTHIPDYGYNKWFDVRRSDPGLSNNENLIVEWLGKNAGIGWMRRADFLDSLIKMLPAGNASFHKRLESYTDVEGSPVQMSFRDGTTAEADVVIGCDGIKSRTRRSMYAEDPAHPPEVEGKDSRAKYSGWVAYRGVVPSSVLEKELGENWGRQTMWTGDSKHILHFMMRNGELVNLVMLMLDSERGSGKDEPWQEEGTTAQLLEIYKDFNDTCKMMLKAIKDISVWGIFDLPELPSYARGRVAISGDAAHGTTTHQGAGAGMCTEDSYFLLKLLTHPDVLSSRSMIPAALQAYDQARRPRCSLIQKTSVEAGLLYECQLPGVMNDTQKMADNMRDRLDWIWFWDEEKALNEAYNYLKGGRQ